MMKTVEIQCQGRGFRGEPVLAKPIAVKIEVHRRPGEPSISSGPRDCPHNTGGHGQRCKAAHQATDKVGDGVHCPFSFDWPYVTEWEIGWKPPKEIAVALEELKASKETA